MLQYSTGQKLIIKMAVKEKYVGVVGSMMQMIQSVLIRLLRSDLRTNCV